MTSESIEELVKILGASSNPLSTQEILRKVKDKCPDASVGMLVALMDSGVIMGEWAAGKGYLWSLSNSNNGDLL